MSDSDVFARLRALSDEAFGRFVADVAETAAPDAVVTLAPPSPAGGVDAVLESETDDRRLLFHVRRQVGPEPDEAGVTDETDAPGRIGDEDDPVGAVTPFAADDLREVVAVGETFDAVVVAVVGPVTPEACAVAEDAGVRLLDGDDLLSLVRRRGVEIPRPESVAERFDRLVERQASEWPQASRDLASRVLAAIESVADFDHRIVHADETTDVDFLLGARDAAARRRAVDPVARARLTETEFRVYVPDADGQFDCVTRLSATREREQTPEAVLDDVLPAVRAVVARRE